MFKILKVLLVAAFALQLYRHPLGYEYCTKEKSYLCKPGQVHTVCDPSVVPVAGELLNLIPMTSKLKKLLIRLQNEARNQTACGSIKDAKDVLYPTATRMRKLLWDDELAFIAEVHAKQCNMEHDKCRNTDRFRHAGQNLGQTTSNKAKLKQRCIECIEKACDGWFTEHKLIEDGPGAAKLLPEADMEKIGHFTALVNDRVSRVGCAVTYCNTTAYKQRTAYTYYTTCNYDYINMHTLPVYETGAVGSKCGDFGTSLSTDYQCLCENNGLNYLTFRPQ